MLEKIEETEKEKAESKPSNAKEKRPERKDDHEANRQSLNNLIKDSNNPEAVGMKKAIDDLRKERSKLIATIKDSRRRLGYKEAESAAIEKLLSMKKDTDADGAKRKRIGYLKRMKAKLEFKISTEASSLSQEKEIIRRINEINQELKEALASVRLERKTGFIKGDIEQYRKNITEVNTKIQELDAKLDGLYANLRKTLGIGAWQNKAKEQRPQKKPQPHPQQGINLEDIVVIKKKGEK